MSRTDLVSFYLPVTAHGVHVAEICYTVRPLIDEGCPGNINGIIADVFVEGLDGKDYSCGDDSEAILRRIKAEQPNSWSEIEAQADRNHKERAA